MLFHDFIKSKKPLYQKIIAIIVTILLFILLSLGLGYLMNLGYEKLVSFLNIVKSLNIVKVLNFYHFSIISFALLFIVNLILLKAKGVKK